MEIPEALLDNEGVSCGEQVPERVEYADARGLEHSLDRIGFGKYSLGTEAGRCTLPCHIQPVL